MSEVGFPGNDSINPSLNRKKTHDSESAHDLRMSERFKDDIESIQLSGNDSINPSIKRKTYDSESAHDLTLSCSQFRNRSDFI